MLRFVATRLGMVVLVTLAVSFLTSMLAGLIPGSPAYAIYGEIPASFAKSWNKSHGLDSGLWAQYGHWLNHALHGNLGNSWGAGSQSVSSLIGQRVSVTAEIAVAAIVVSLVVAIVVALVASLRPDGVLDHVVTAIAALSSSTPPFVSGVFLVGMLSVHWRWFPSQGFVSLTTSPGANLKAIALPVATLFLIATPVFIRVLRGDLVSIQDEDFVIAARSRGIPEHYILTRYVLRLASASLVTVAGISFGAMLGGSIIVEIFYNIPGLGHLAVDAVGLKDIPVIQGIVVCVAIFFVLVNSVIDVLYRVIDPRVRLS